MKHMRTCHKAVTREHGIETSRSAIKRSSQFLVRKTWLLVLCALFAVSLNSYAEKDTPPAFVLEDIAKAEKGDVNAQYNTGYRYYEGDEVEQDYEEAVKWFRKAAQQGDAMAQMRLATCFHSGDGVPKDIVEAIQWYRKAADQGDEEAQCVLGYLYHNGQGVPKDFVQAYKWYSLGAGSVGKDQLSELRKLEAKMTPAQIERGNNLISEMKKDKPSAVGSKEADKKTSDSPKAGQQSTFDGAISDVEDRWFSLETNQTYIADFKLAGGAAQKLKVKSEKERIWVCFRADGTPAVNKKHLGGVPLRMQQKDGVWVCGSLLAGTLFHPIDGVIHLTVTNEVDDPFRVVVYTKNE
jgi:hypothetical protein